MKHFTVCTEAVADDFKGHVEDIILSALHDGTVTSSTLLECVYYVVEPDILATIRAVAALPAGERLMVMSYSKQLLDGRAGQAQP